MKTNRYAWTASLLLLLPVPVFFLQGKPAAAAGSPEAGEKNDSLYAIVYTTGENWDTAKSAWEQKAFDAHSRHLSRLRKSGTIKIGARFSDKGLIILHAKNTQEAKAILSRDTSVMQKTFKAEIFPFNVFYAGCVDKEQ